MSLPTGWGRRRRRGAPAQPLDPSDPAAFFLGTPATVRRQRKTEEEDFQAVVINLARYLGYLIFHDYDATLSPTGFPDLVLVRAPRVIFAELKSEKGRLSHGKMGRGRNARWKPGQVEWIEALKQCPGVETYVWRPSEYRDVERILLGADWRPNDT